MVSRARSQKRACLSWKVSLEVVFIHLWNEQRLLTDLCRSFGGVVRERHKFSNIETGFPYHFFGAKQRPSVQLIRIDVIGTFQLLTTREMCDKTWIATLEFSKSNCKLVDFNQWQMKNSISFHGFCWKFGKIQIDAHTNNPHHRILDPPLNDRYCFKYFLNVS